MGSIAYSRADFSYRVWLYIVAIFACLVIQILKQSRLIINWRFDKADIIEKKGDFSLIVFIFQ